MNSRKEQSFNFHFRPLGQPAEGTIGLAVGHTSLGEVIVARSQRGICAILLDDSEASVLNQLRTAFSQVDLLADPFTLRHELDHLIAFIERGSADASVDFDVRGTSFQQRVWQSLCEIPAGQTRSYCNVAQALNMPAAVRAIAGACAANILAEAIPCHRAVRSDGAISGYRWGVERKRSLLRRESNA